MENQSFRKPRVAAERGNIFDRNGQALVENRPQYNVVLYLEDLRSQFTNEYYSHVVREYLRRPSRDQRRQAALPRDRTRCGWKPITGWSATSVTRSAAELEQPIDAGSRSGSSIFTPITPSCRCRF